MSDEDLERLGLLVPSYYKQHAPRSPKSQPKPWSKTKKKKRESRPEQRERLKRLENEPVPQLFQNNPDRLAIGFQPSGWTRTVEGFWKSARQRKKAVIRNNRMTGRKFTRLCNINLYEPRHPALLNRDFKAFVKILEARWLVGHWTIQINRHNVVHWHILFIDCHLTPKALKRLVQRCLGEVDTFPRNRVYTDTVRKQGQILDYILQVRKQGYGEANDKDAGQGKVSWTTSHDIYKNDRLLFVPKTGLHKNGTIGRFWAKGFNEKKLWNLICEETKTVARNYENPRVKEYVHWISEKFGIPLSWARWNIALNRPQELLNAGSVSPWRDPPVRNQRRFRPSRPSSGLVATVFSGRRHHIPALKPRRAVSKRFNAHEIGQIGSPRSAPMRWPKKRFSEPSVGVLRDTQGTNGISPFRNEEPRNSWRKTFELGP